MSSYDFNFKANSTGNYNFIFDNSRNNVSSNVTLNYTHHVPSANIGGGEFSIPEFPGQVVAVAVLTALMVLSYAAMRRSLVAQASSREREASRA